MVRTAGGMVIVHHNWRGDEDQVTVDAFHELHYRTERHAHLRWRGVEMWKNCTDAMAYAEIIQEVRPALIVECGTFLGGSGLFFAEMCELNGTGTVVTIDSTTPGERGFKAPDHPRLIYKAASSTDPTTIEWANGFVRLSEPGPVMVSLDSDHTAAHVRAELDLWAPLVTPGSWLVVEDTNLGHEVLPDWGPGPAEALEEWLPEHPEFVRRTEPERFLLSSNPGGWLQRVTE